MLDFDELAVHYDVSVAKGVKSNKVEINKIQLLHFDCETPHSYFFKHNYNEQLREVRIGKNDKHIETKGTISMVPLQSSVTEVKKKDLLWMCSELIITRDYKLFYDSLCENSSESRSSI